MPAKEIGEILSEVGSKLSSIEIDDLAGIGTFVSSIIALIALKEIIKQRRAMYQPSLFLNEFSLSVKGNPLLGNKNFFYYKLYNLHEPRNKSDKTPHSIQSQFFLQNFGYGIANKVKYKWDFDYESAIKQICKIDPKVNVEKSKDSIILIRKNEYFDSYDPKDFKTEKKIDFIKPESISTNNKPLSIPIAITSLHMNYVLLKNKMENEKTRRFNHEEFENFPKPKLTVTYEDIARKKYTNSYIFSITCGNTFFQDIKQQVINTSIDYALLSFKIE